MISIYRLLLVFIAFSTMHVMYGQTFLSTHLEEISRKILFEKALPDKENPNVKRTIYNGRDVMIQLDGNNCVTHIGYEIFHPEMRTLSSSVVCDFVERYFLYLDCCCGKAELKQRLDDDRVEFVEGTLSSLNKITKNTPVSIRRVDDAFYQITWSEGTKVLLAIRVPVNYEILLGMPKVELEKHMKNIIMKAACSNHTSVQPISVEKEELGDGLWGSCPLLSYQIESLNNRSYYVKNDAGMFRPVYDNDHKFQSAANLFLGVIPQKSYTPMSLFIQQNVYGGKKQTYSVPLASWLSYCKENDLEVYVGKEEEGSDGLKILLIAHSKDLNYNHMMTIIIPNSFVGNQKVVLKASLNAFIPTQNVSNLYQQYTKSNRKKVL